MSFKLVSTGSNPDCHPVCCFDLALPMGAILARSAVLPVLA